MKRRTFIQSVIGFVISPFLPHKKAKCITSAQRTFDPKQSYGWYRKFNHAPTERDVSISTDMFYRRVLPISAPPKYHKKFIRTDYHGPDLPPNESLKECWTIGWVYRPKNAPKSNRVFLP